MYFLKTRYKIKILITTLLIIIYPSQSKFLFNFFLNFLFVKLYTSTMIFNPIIHQFLNLIFQISLNLKASYKFFTLNPKLCWAGLE